MKKCCTDFIDNLNKGRPIPSSPQSCLACGEFIYYDIGHIEEPEHITDEGLTLGPWTKVSEAISNPRYLSTE